MRGWGPPAGGALSSSSLLPLCTMSYLLAQQAQGEVGTLSLRSWACSVASLALGSISQHAGMHGHHHQRMHTALTTRMHAMLIAQPGHRSTAKWQAWRHADCCWRAVCSHTLSACCHTDQSAAIMQHRWRCLHSNPTPSALSENCPIPIPFPRSLHVLPRRWGRRALCSYAPAPPSCPLACLVSAARTPCTPRCRPLAAPLSLPAGRACAAVRSLVRCPHHHWQQQRQLMLAAAAPPPLPLLPLCWQRLAWNCCGAHLLAYAWLLPSRPSCPPLPLLRRLPLLSSSRPPAPRLLACRKGSRCSRRAPQQRTAVGLTARSLARP